MGKKRKLRSEEEIRRKIQKLEAKLAKTTNERRDSISPEENLNNSPPETPYSELLPYYYESDLGTMQPVESPARGLSPPYTMAQPVSSQPPSPQLPAIRSPSPHPPSPGPLPQEVLSQPAPPQPGTSDNSKPEELELEDDILQLLGDAPKAETPLGPPIHKDVARRWQDILVKGLPKDVKESLIKEYLVPSNCDLLLPPALNPEVKAALPDPLVKRDSSLLYKQKQLGVALSALATVTDMIISNENSKQKLLKPLSDACRILCDSHFSETRTRRGFVISSINAKLKQPLIDSTRDKLLFGENVSEKLKAAKTIQQSGEAFKNAPKQRFQRPNVPSTSTNKSNLNFIPQHRKTNAKPINNRRAPNYQHRQPQTTNARRPADRDRPSTSRTAAHHRR